MSIKLSRERKVFIGVASIAIAGLGADRLFFGSGLSGPAEASAALNDAELGGALDPEFDATLEEIEDRAATIAVPAEALTELLAGQFEEFSQQADVEVTGLSNVFRPSGSWLPEAAAQEVVIGVVDEFIARHSLSAVMCSKMSPGAVVNRKLLKIGEEIDGWVLMAVEKEFVVFEADGEQAILELRPSGTDS